ncbi:MAG TPA: hypothetical protein VGH19_15440 [Verrucomicrobiae bacterium]
MKKPYYQGFTREELRSRLFEHSTPNYMTLISVIQGLALAVLLQKVFEGEHGGMLQVKYWIFALISFISIIMVFFLYNWFWSVTWSPPDFRETVLPLVLGLTQTIPIYHLNQPSVWWASFALFLLVSIFALKNTIRLIQRMTSSDCTGEIYELCVKEEQKNIKGCFIMGLVALLAALLSLWGSENVLRDWIFGLVVVSVTGLMAWSGQNHFLNRIYAMTGLLDKQDGIPNDSKTGS